MSDILRWETVITRKPHHCWGCGKTHPAGTSMINAAYVDGGSVSSCYWCDVCMTYMNRHFEYGDECGYAEIYANDKATWEQIQSELLEEK